MERQISTTLESSAGTIVESVSVTPGGFDPTTGKFTWEIEIETPSGSENGEAISAAVLGAFNNWLQSVGLSPDLHVPLISLAEPNDTDGDESQLTPLGGPGAPTEHDLLAEQTIEATILADLENAMIDVDSVEVTVTYDDPTHPTVPTFSTSVEISGSVSSLPTAAEASLFGIIGDAVTSALHGLGFDEGNMGAIVVEDSDGPIAPPISNAEATTAPTTFNAGATVPTSQFVGMTDQEILEALSYLEPLDAASALLALRAPSRVALLLSQLDPVDSAPILAAMATLEPVQAAAIFAEIKTINSGKAALILREIATNPAIVPEHAAAFLAELAETDAAGVADVAAVLEELATTDPERAIAILVAMTTAQAAAILAKMLPANAAALLAYSLASAVALWVPIPSELFPAELEAPEAQVTIFEDTQPLAQASVVGEGLDDAAILAAIAATDPARAKAIYAKIKILNPEITTRLPWEVAGSSAIPPADAAAFLLSLTENPTALERVVSSVDFVRGVAVLAAIAAINPILATSISSKIESKYSTSSVIEIITEIATNPAIVPEHAAAFFAAIAGTDTARVTIATALAAIPDPARAAAIWAAIAATYPDLAAAIFGAIPDVKRAAEILAAMEENDQAEQAGAILAAMVENHQAEQAAAIFAAMTNPAQAAVILLKISDTARVEILAKMIAVGNIEHAAAILDGIQAPGTSLQLFGLLSPADQNALRGVTGITGNWLTP